MILVIFYLYKSWSVCNGYFLIGFMHELEIFNDTSVMLTSVDNFNETLLYEGHPESRERFGMDE